MAQFELIDSKMKLEPPNISNNVKMEPIELKIGHPTYNPYPKSELYTPPIDRKKYPIWQPSGCTISKPPPACDTRFQHILPHAYIADEYHVSTSTPIPYTRVLNMGLLGNLIEPALRPYPHSLNIKNGEYTLSSGEFLANIHCQNIYNHHYSIEDLKVAQLTLVCNRVGGYIRQFLIPSLDSNTPAKIAPLKREHSPLFRRRIKKLKMFLEESGKMAEFEAGRKKRFKEVYQWLHSYYTDTDYVDWDSWIEWQ